MSSRTYVGVDENGLGPRLGPLLVTAVTARATDEGAPFLTKKPRGGLASRLGDSKRLVSFDDSALGEAWARSLAGTEEPLRVAAASARSALARSGRDASRACPSHHEQQCWGDRDEAFVADAAAVEAIGATSRSWRRAVCR